MRITYAISAASASVKLKFINNIADRATLILNALDEIVVLDSSKLEAWILLKS